MMFGEVGGLNDFFALILATFFGYFSERFLQASLVEKLFRAIAAKGRSNLYSMAPTTMNTMQSKLTSPVSFTRGLILELACTKGSWCSKRSEPGHR